MSSDNQQEENITTSSSSSSPPCPKAHFTVLPGCGVDPSCITIEIEIEGGCYDGTSENEKEKTTKSTFYTIRHATSAHVDACSAAEIEPLDKAVTIPLSEQRVEKNSAEEEKKPADDDDDEGEKDKQEINDDDDQQQEQEKEDGHDTGKDDSTPDEAKTDDDNNNTETAVEKENKQEERKQSPSSPNNKSNDKTKKEDSETNTSTNTKKLHARCHLVKGDAKTSHASLTSIGANFHPIHVAALIGNITGLRNYAKKYGKEIFGRPSDTDDKRSICEVATRSQNLDVVKFLVEECEVSFHTVNIHQVTPFMLCVFAKDQCNHITKYLLEKYSSAEELGTDFYSAREHMAATAPSTADDDKELATNKNDKAEGENALSWAILGSNFEIADILVSDKFKATLSPRLKVYDFIEALCTRADVEAVKFVLTKCNVQLVLADTSNTPIRQKNHPFFLPTVCSDSEKAFQLFEVIRENVFINNNSKKEDDDDDEESKMSKVIIIKVGTEPANDLPGALSTDAVSPFSCAARNGHKEIIDALVKLGKGFGDEIEMNRENSLVGTPLLFASTPLGISVIDHLLDIGCDPHRANQFFTPYLNRLLYWDMASYKYMANSIEPELRAYADRLKHGKQFYNIILRLLREYNFPPNGRHQHHKKDETKDIVAHNQKYRRRQNNKYNHPVCLQGTLYEHPITHLTTTLPTALMIIDFGAQYKSNNNNNNKNNNNNTINRIELLGNRSLYALRFHDLKTSWMRFFYFLYGYSSNDATSTDLSSHSYPTTIAVGCEMLIRQREQLAITLDQNRRYHTTMTPEQKQALLEERKKKPPLTQNFVETKRRQIFATYNYFKSQTTLLGQVQCSGVTGGTPNTSYANLFSSQGIFQFLQDRISMSLIQFMHGRLGWLRTPERWGYLTSDIEKS